MSQIFLSHRQDHMVDLLTLMEELANTAHHKINIELLNRRAEIIQSLERSLEYNGPFAHSTKVVQLDNKKQ